MIVESSSFFFGQLYFVLVKVLYDIRTLEKEEALTTEGQCSIENRTFMGKMRMLYSKDEKEKRKEKNGLVSGLISSMTNKR